MTIKGKGGISAKIVADSVSPEGKRVTTFELEFHRFLLPEFNTHRMFSRNAASSRAIPVPKMIEHVEQHTAMPIHWGANQKGMQADNECDNYIAEHNAEFSREAWWSYSACQAMECAERFHESGYHKQIVNRLLEPFQFIKVVCTATEYDNFFWLRNHPDAQPEIKELAACMWEAQRQSKPKGLKENEWHLPYVESCISSQGICYFISHEEGPEWLSTEDAIKVSASCCAQVSYRLTDNSLEKAKKIYQMLVESKPVHASPFEHQCVPMPSDVSLETKGVTGYNNSLGFVSGNFAGWTQHRQLIDEHTCWNYEPE